MICIQVNDVRCDMWMKSDVAVVCNARVTFQWELHNVNINQYHYLRKLLLIASQFPLVIAFFLSRRNGQMDLLVRKNFPSHPLVCRSREEDPQRSGAEGAGLLVVLVVVSFCISVWVAWATRAPWCRVKLSKDSVAWDLNTLKIAVVKNFFISPSDLAGHCRIL